ncbi:helix-turn-helix domain-containing protein [Photobacterium sp. CAU 1568]|uniref:Helix-turn-helix domain-containing protein n=1 Tax=Photobacterium arenosum TaxID=2774143 RepID=A0ABR9BMZ9_9GAMM|nr:helix-turn-helix domain-containing protein [Photobacterium arenosum]MBD8513947.1 helix-turn-helix domain-containing protein [Photobacterium arenosum]
MNLPQFSIGQLAQRAGCKVETVHYYEKAGLMPNPPRTDGGHRVYTLPHVKRLNFIRRSRELGFSIQHIKELLRFIDEPDHYCCEVQAIATLHARAVQQKIDDLERLKAALDKMVSQCKGHRYSIEECPIIDALYVEK